VTEYRASKTAVRLKVVLLLAGFWFLAILAATQGEIAGALLLVLFGVLFGALPLLEARSFKLTVYPDKVEQIRSLIARRVTTIEATKVEGVETREGVIGRALGYGYVFVTGTGGKGIATVAVDHPDQVAAVIRGINAVVPRASIGSSDAPSNLAHRTDVEGMDEALRRLSKLHDDGLLDDSEFQAQKQKILAQG
jgi:membrane protein YdbS with pleckstrin-like domain